MSTYIGRLTREGGHLQHTERDDERAVLSISGRQLTATLPSGANPWTGVVEITGTTLRAHLWDAWGCGLDVVGQHRDGGYDLQAEGMHAPHARLPLVEDAA